MIERLPTRESEMRKDELKPEVRRFVDKLEAQMKERVAALGFRNFSELQAAITEGSPSFETNPERRAHILLVSEKITALLEKYYTAKERNIVLESDYEYENPEFVERFADRLISMVIGEKSKAELLNALEKAETKPYWSTRDFIEDPEFPILKEPTEIEILRLSPEEVGFKEWPDIGYIYRWVKEKKLGLEPCPPEAALYYMLSKPEAAKVPIDRTIFGFLMQKQADVPRWWGLSVESSLNEWDGSLMSSGINLDNRPVALQNRHNYFAFKVKHKE